MATARRDLSNAALRLHGPAERGAGRDAWTPGELAGRLVEVSGRARLSLAIGLLAAAQQRHEPAAWITCAEGLFFPGDADASGLDLAALPIVRVTDPVAAARAADLLLRSGAFGVLVLDLCDLSDGSERGARVRVPLAVQSRLVGLAQKHGSALLCLTDKDAGAPSLGSLVSLRLDAWREKARDGRLLCGVRAVKDKRRGPGWTHEEVLRGPPGLR